MKSKILLILILIIQQLIVPIPGKTQGDLCPLLGFYTDGITGSPDISAVNLKPPIPSSISTLPGGFSTVNFPISNSLKPTNTSAYDPATGDYVCIIAQEQKMLYYNGSSSSPILSTVPLSAPATAPVYFNGRLFGINVTPIPGTGELNIELVRINPNTGQVNTVYSFVSPSYFVFSTDIISSATDGTNIFFGSHNKLIVYTNVLPTPITHQVITLPYSFKWNLLGLEYIAPGNLLAITSPNVFPNPDQNLIGIDISDPLNPILNSVFPISQNIPAGPTGSVIDIQYYSTALINTSCERKYFISTLIESPYGTSYPFTRLIEIDINSGVAPYNDIPGYLFGLEAETRNCCQAYPCDALVNQIKGQNIEFGKSIAVDKDGFIYTTGGFIEEALFAGNSSAVNLISAGDQDIYIAKHYPDTDFNYAVRIGESGFDEGRGIAVSEQGYVYITGVYTDINTGLQGAIVQKRDNSLNTVIWQKTFYSPNGLVNGNAIAIDQNENVYVTGYFTGRGQFDGNTYSSYGGSADVFIARLSGADGSVNWVRRIGGDGEDYGKGIAVDHLGNVSVVGDFQYQLVVPYNLNIQLASNGGSRDVFLTRLNAAGDFHWVKNMGGISNDSGNAIAIDPSGDLYITGDFIYDASINGFNFPQGAGPGGLYDAYVSKHSGNVGTAIWSAQLRGANSGVRGRGWSIAINKSGTRVYTTGIFNGLTDFNPGSPSVYFLDPTGFEMFVSRLDASNGGFVDAFKLGPVPNTPGGFPEKYSNAIAVDKSGCVHTTGTFFGTVDFDPSPSPSYLLLSVSSSPNHYHDAFVHKFCCCCDERSDFDYLVSQGWNISIDQQNCEVTVEASHFKEDCHYIRTEGPDWGDGTPVNTGIYSANGLWTHTYATSGTYFICFQIFEEHNGVECWSADVCYEIEIECCPDSTSVSIPDSIVCTTHSSFTIPINCPTNCIVDRVDWFIKDVNAPNFPVIPYQSIPGPTCAGLTILPGQFAGFEGLHVYAVIHFDPTSCCGITHFTTNIATIKLCGPISCNIINPHPEGFCEYGVPDPLVVNIFANCAYQSLEWIYNGNVVSNWGYYQPDTLAYDSLGTNDCYTEHKFTVKLTGVCGESYCHTSIFVYNPNSPLGVLEMNPDEDQPFCYGEDATLEYDHACAGISPEWWIPKWTWHSTTIDPPAIADYQIIPGAGTSNPVYNTNQLFETTWFMIEKQNGVCPEQHIQYKIEVLEPLVINSFQAVTNPCAENLVNLSVDFSPSPLPLPQNADVHWYVNGDLIGTSMASTSPVHYPFYYPGNIAGVYYAEILEYYCNQTIETPPVIIEPSCTPVVSGPCYRCFEDINPIELTGDMVVPPGLPCPDISNCSFQWYEIDNTGNLIPIPGATGLTHFSPHAATFVLFSDCNGCQKWSSPHTVIQCDQVLSVEDEPKGFLTVNIYPNPTMNEVNINVMPAPNRNSTVTISDINGKILKSAVLPANTDNIRIDMNDIRAGFYLVHIYEDQRLVWIDKIIIIK